MLSVEVSLYHQITSTFLHLKHYQLHCFYCRFRGNLRPAIATASGTAKTPGNLQQLKQPGWQSLILIPFREQYSPAAHRETLAFSDARRPGTGDPFVNTGVMQRLLLGSYRSQVTRSLYILIWVYFFLRIRDDNDPMVRGDMICESMQFTPRTTMVETAVNGA